MRIEFKENNGRELVSVEDGRVALKNFRGDKFGNGGKRSFCLVIPTEEIKDELIKRGWNVRIKPPFHEDEEMMEEVLTFILNQEIILYTKLNQITV